MRITKLLLLLFFVQQTGFGQLQGGNTLPEPNIDTSGTDSGYVNINPPIKTYQEILNNLLSANKFINLREKPLPFINKRKQFTGKEYLFYLLSGIILVFGIFKLFYAGYFNNIFRVFFSTSLRQNQLTDLLLQARLPSLIFNVFFTVTAGLYTWLLLQHYNFINEGNYRMLIFCILAIGFIYIGKYCVLKFVGWITEMSSVVNTYIFVIFLINKIVGITLIPFVIFLAFAPKVFFKSIALLSLMMLLVFFIMRFFRSYSILQHQVSLTRLHFLLYVLSLEILPILVIYKISLRFF